MYVLSIIPARKGSKRIKNKNIKKLNGKELIFYTIKKSLECKLINRTIVTTNCYEIAELSKKYGADVPFLRPDEISDDMSTDIEFMIHCIDWLKNNNNPLPDFIVHLRPTHPIRDSKIIDDAIDIFIKNYDNYDSLRSISKNTVTPYKMYFINNKKLDAVVTDKRFKESFNMPFQSLPETYIGNAYVDIYKTSIIENNILNGNRIYPFITEKFIDLDTNKDWDKLEKLFKNM